MAENWTGLLRGVHVWQGFMTTASETTQILKAISDGDRSGIDRLAEIVYDQLRMTARRYLSRERRNHTLQPTALVHEAFLKLVDQKQTQWRSRSHFYAVAAQQMRRILVDHAKSKLRAKRGGGRQKISLIEELTVSREKDEDVLAVDEALEKLARLNPEQAKIVELRFFAGMTVDEVAEALQMSKRTVERNWTMIRAWLRRELAGDEAEERA